MKERGLASARVVAGLGVVDVFLHRAGVRGGERVLVAFVLLVVLVKRFLADVAARRAQEAGERSVRELDRFALLVLNHAELEVGIGELAKHAVGGAGHFALHGEQLLFAGAERVRLVADQAFELQPIWFELLRLDVLFEFLFREGQDFRANKAGGFAGMCGGVIVAAAHSLVAAVGHVFRGFEMGVRAEPFCFLIELRVELEEFGKRSRGRRRACLGTFRSAGFASPRP